MFRIRYEVFQKRPGCQILLCVHSGYYYEPVEADLSATQSYHLWQYGHCSLAIARSADLDFWVSSKAVRFAVRSLYNQKGIEASGNPVKNRMQNPAGARCLHLS